MPKQYEIDMCYMQCAEAHAALSKGERAKVGAVLVTPQGVVIPGVNGLPSKLGNQLEFSIEQYNVNTAMYDKALVTKPEVIHAELNCILKAAKEGISMKDSKLYVTLMPCVACGSMIIQAGIKEVIYKAPYRDTTALDNFTRAKVTYRQFGGTYE